MDEATFSKRDLVALVEQYRYLRHVQKSLKLTMKRQSSPAGKKLVADLLKIIKTR